MGEESPDGVRFLSLPGTSFGGIVRLGAAHLSVPTREHYLPLLYALAVKDEAEPIAYFNDAATMGSISMRSLIIG